MLESINWGWMQGPRDLEKSCSRRLLQTFSQVLVRWTAIGMLSSTQVVAKHERHREQHLFYDCCRWP